MPISSSSLEAFHQLNHCGWFPSEGLAEALSAIVLVNVVLQKANDSATDLVLMLRVHGYSPLLFGTTIIGSTRAVGPGLSMHENGKGYQHSC